MRIASARWVKPVAMILALGFLAACGLPQTGPNKREIFAGSVQNSGDAFVIEVNDRVTRATAVVPALGFSSSFETAPQLTTDTINAGDTLGLTIWENVDNGLLSGAGGNSTMLEEVQVDSAGYIFVPYAGRVQAAGNTPDSLREVITAKLEEQTPDPQVQVHRLAGDGATVSLVGGVGKQGVYPIERSTRTLAAMLAQAGGVVIEPEIAQVTVIRGNQRGTIWFQDLFDKPQYDIALRSGDRILVEEDDRAFTAMGATGRQTRIRFETQDMSALEALASVGGLVGTSSDPTGIFIFRNEPAAIAGQVLGRDDLTGAQRMIYVLNLKEPNGVFLARDFVIRDADTVYVTEAPFSQWSKSISLFSGALTPFANVATLTGN